MPLNTVKDLKDREAVIEQAKSTGRTERVPFRGEYKDLEVSGYQTMSLSTGWRT